MIRKSPKAQMAIVTWHGSTDPASRLARGVHSGGTFTVFYGNKEVDDLIDRQQQMVDKAKRKVILDKIKKILYDDPSTIPLYGLKHIYANSDRVDYDLPHKIIMLYNLWETKIIKE